MAIDDIKQLLKEKRYAELKEKIKDMQIQDIAEIVDELDTKNAIILFRLLPKEIAADVFSYLSSERQSEISMMIDENELNEIVSDLFFDDKIDFLEEMPANVVKRILRNTSEAERKLINQFLQYPEYSAGSLMTIEFVDLKKEMTVAEALEKIRRVGRDREIIYTCYVTDARRKLEGIVSLKDLVLASPDTKVEDIMKKDVIYVDTYDDQEEVADVFKKYDLLAVPVVDQEKRLVGIITIDDIVDVIEEENTEDIQRMAAIQPTEEEYLDATPFMIARKRLLWLLILMISATVSGYIIRKYQVALEAVVALAAFIPMLMDTAGNAGSQASVTVIRSLVLGELGFRDVFKVIWKEAQVGVLVGVALALVNFIRVYFVEGYVFGIAITISLSLIFTVIIAKIIGGTLPMIAKRIGLDPAIMASPLITTIADAISLTIYFSLAVWILHISI
ncbi:magnesium transporter [Caldicoprobacter algeriensis]|uniref:magnesium transporter n=1 Tax=Caldicoprobacter algeriensis TaxID=699281 RepID=UPI0023EE9FAF|nr:magnesium transporter [Caldicoprobacter algeriensis]MCM8900448.1 magnesium transporter [Caldicoprobacter algeriensis]